MNTSEGSFKLYNGVKVDPVGYGTYLARPGSVSEAVKAGYRYFDTASFYKNEEMVGKELRSCGISREDVFIASKIWPTEFGYEEGKEAFERSLKRLQTDYLDLYLLHWPLVKGDPEWKEHLISTWKAVSELYREGRIRAVGVSNFLPHHLQVLYDSSDIKPMVDQLELHVGYMQQYTVDHCRENGIHVQAWSPLGRGRLRENRTVLKMASDYGVTPGNFLLRFLNQQGISIIPKTDDPGRMRSNLDIGGFTISDHDMSYLMSMPQTAFSGEHPDMDL